MTTILKAEFRVLKGLNVNSRGCEPTEYRPHICSALTGPNVFWKRIPQVSPAAIHVGPLRGQRFVTCHMSFECGGVA